MNNRFCNNVVKTRGDERNEITYRFVTDGAGGVPARATVRIGDKDPLTFETVTEEFVKDYHRMEDREVYYNQKSTGMLHGCRTLSYDYGMPDDADRSCAEVMPEMGTSGSLVPDEIIRKMISERLAEITGRFSGRMKEVYEAMLSRQGGKGTKIRVVELARKWGVSERQIGYDQEKIARIIREEMREWFE